MVTNQNPFLTLQLAQGFGKAKNKQAIEQRIVEAESEAPLPSKNRYRENDEILSRPVDYHDAKAMLVYLSTAIERPVIQRQYMINKLVPIGLFCLLLGVIAVVLAFTLSSELRFLLYLFCIIFAVLIALAALAVFVDIFTYCHTWKTIRNGRYFKHKDPRMICDIAVSLCGMHNEFVTRIREQAEEENRNDAG